MKKALFSLIIACTLSVSFCFAQIEKQNDIPYSSIMYVPSVDGSSAWVTFTVTKHTKIYLLSIISGEESIKSSHLRNMNKEMRIDNESVTIVRTGSAMLMGKYNWILGTGTVVNCVFSKDPAFVATKIEFKQTNGGQSFLYNLETKEWE